MSEISMKPVVELAHIAGAEPAGICLRIKVDGGQTTDFYLTKEMVQKARDMLQTALDEHLPPYTKGKT